MVTSDVHFIMYLNVESPCCTPETNAILHTNYISNKRRNKGSRAELGTVGTKGVAEKDPGSKESEQGGGRGQQPQKDGQRPLDSGEAAPPWCSAPRAASALWSVDALCTPSRGVEEGTSWS